MKTTLTLAIFLICYNICAYCQKPELIKDINSSQPTNLLSDGTYIGQTSCTFGAINGLDQAPKRPYKVNGVAVFFADDGKGQRGLWRTDGTKAGTYLLSNLNAPLTENIGISRVYSTDSVFYFAVDSLYDNYGEESPIFNSLWCSDGTPQGTRPVFSGTDKYISFTYGILPATSIGKTFYFVGAQQINDTTYTNIYKTNGTAAGTKIYFNADKQTGVGVDPTESDGVIATQMVSLNGKIYFNYSNINDNTGYQIWTGDGVTTPHLLTPSAPNYYQINVSEWTTVNNKYILMLGYMNNGLNLMRINATDTAAVVLASNIGDGDGYTTLSYYQQGDYMSNGDICYFYQSWTMLGSTNGETAGTYAISLPNHYSVAGACTKGVVYTAFGAYYGDSVKTYIWDGLSATSQKVLSDSLNGGNAAVSGVVQMDSSLIVFDGDDFKSVWQTGLTTPYCYRINIMQLADKGVKLNDSMYVALGQGTGGEGVFNAGIEPLLIKKTNKVWTGVASANWNDNNNWWPIGVPSLNDDVAVGPSKNNPVVTANAACRNLTINYNGHFFPLALTVNNGFNLDIYGYVANYGDINGAGAITRTGTNSGKTYGDGTYNIDSINIEGTDWDLTSTSFFSPNSITLNSVINFKSDNKLIMNEELVAVTKKPFFTGFNAKRYVVNNRINTSVDLGQGDFGDYNSLFLGGFVVTAAAPSDSVITIPIGTTKSYAPVVFNYPFTFANGGANIYALVTDTVRKKGFSGALVNTNVVNKLWDLTNEETTTNLNFSWAANEEAPGFDRNACFIAAYDGTEWVTFPAQAAVLNNGLYSINFNVYIGPFVTYSFFIVCSNSNALPVNLTAFTAELIKGTESALLNWQTATEINTAYFNVQRSVDGQRFANVGNVNAAGNSAQLENYLYTDDFSTLGLMPPVLYYRLQIVDKDGAVTYSKIVTLTLISKWIITVMPNPVKDVITIYSSADVAGAAVTLTDISGKTLSHFTQNIAAGQQIQIPVSGLAGGIYLVTVENGNERKQFKVVKK